MNSYFKCFKFYYYNLCYNGEILKIFVWSLRCYLECLVYFFCIILGIKMNSEIGIDVVVVINNG